MCDLSKDIPDTQAGPQLIKQAGGLDQDPLGQLDTGTKNIGLPTKKVPTKFGTFLKYAMPALQGGLYGLGSRQPTHALGGGSFGSGFGSGFGNVQNLVLQRNLANRQFGLEAMDRQLRLAQLQNTQAYQQGRLGVAQGGLEARLQAMENRSDEQKWMPFPTDQGLFELETKTGMLRPAMLPGAGGGSTQPQATGPLDAGGAGGAAPAVPTLDDGRTGVAGSVPAGMFGNALPVNAPSAGRPQIPSWRTAGLLPSSAAPGGAPSITTANQTDQLTRKGKSKHQPGDIIDREGIPFGVYGENDTPYYKGDPKMPPQFQTQLDQAMKVHAQGLQEKKDVAASGRISGQDSKPTTQYDTVLGITRTVKAKEAEDHPERYHVASYSNIVDSTQKIATIREIDKNIDRTFKIADAIKAPGLTSNVIAAGLADPASDLGQQFQGQMIKSLTPDQRNVINYVRNLRQGVASYKNILSTGGVTDARLNLLEQEMPGIPEIASGDPKIFRQKLQAWTDTYKAVRDKYAKFFSNMLGENLDQGSGGSSSAAPPNPYRKAKAN